MGLGLYVLGIAVGGLLLLAFFLVPPLLSDHPARALSAMLVGILLAFPAAAVYLTVPRLLDRYDPEPWYALVGCLLWGGIAACGFSAAINEAVGVIGAGFGGRQAGQVLAAVVSAPLAEEFWKGLGVLGVFLFLRREFDGVVDGIIYATFTALGFAAVENVIYYSQAAMEGTPVLAFTFAMRGVLVPWGHPLYTAMTGIGIGIARETTSPPLRWGAPLVGYGLSVFLHAVWNGSATLAQGFFCLTLPLWFMFVAAFLAMVIVLVRRRGRIIREHLEDEVALGTIYAAELQLVGSPFGTVQARVQYGQVGREFVRAIARLALHKWHAARARRGAMSTASDELIGPLRERISTLRQQLPRG